MNSLGVLSGDLLTRVCIIDKEEKQGIPIKDDIVIGFIRAAKKRLGVF